MQSEWIPGKAVATERGDGPRRGAAERLGESRLQDTAKAEDEGGPRLAFEGVASQSEASHAARSSSRYEGSDGACKARSTRSSEGSEDSLGEEGRVTAKGSGKRGTGASGGTAAPSPVKVKPVANTNTVKTKYDKVPLTASKKPGLLPAEVPGEEAGKGCWWTALQPMLELVDPSRATWFVPPRVSRVGDPLQYIEPQ